MWHQYYTNPAHQVYTFLFWLVEQARKTKSIPVMDVQRSLNRLILYQVSNIPSTEADQKTFMDTLCMFSSQAQVKGGEGGREGEREGGRENVIE